jgi:adenine deaminase
LNLAFKKYSIETRTSLVRVALGLEPADIAIKSVNLVEVNTGVILEDVSVLVKSGRVAGVVKTNSVDKYTGPQTLVISREGFYIIPGFIDLHVHVESSMLDPIGFSKLALRHGTTTIVADPHEIVNVLGIEGFKIFSEAAKKTPLKILLELPSCVPPTGPSAKLETPSSSFRVKDLEYASTMDSVVGLGEVMDYSSVLDCDEEIYEKIRAAYNHDLIVNGHAPLLSSEELNAYISAGILSDHESTEINEAYEKAWRGMYLYIREGSAWRDLEKLVDIVKKTTCKLCAFVSDDVSVLDLYEHGHMDRVINRAIELGVDPVKAIQLATINPALRLHLEDHIGLVAPGRLADIVFTKRLERIEPATVLANGELIYHNGALIKDISSLVYPETALNTVKVSPKRIEELKVTPEVNSRVESVRVNAIEVIPGSALTRRSVVELKVSSRRVLPDPERDVMYVGVLYRHSNSGEYSIGFIKNLEFKLGAVAQTIAHDTHNIVFAGWSESDIKLAVKRLTELQGGIVIVNKGRVLGELQLKLAGLMSIEEPETVYKKYRAIVDLLREHGSIFEHVFMTLSLISLPVIPEIRITDKGIVDVKAKRTIPLILESDT